MATNELKTTLSLDIKPFLDAIKKAANQISTLEELKPKFDTTEFNKIQSEIQKLSGEVNVDVTIEGKSIEEAQTKIDAISKRQLEIPVDIDAEQINRQLGRVGDLRPRISQAELNRVSNQIKNLRPNLNVDFNADRGSINNLQNTISSLNGDVDLNVVVNDTQLQDVKSDVRAVEAEDVNVNVVINSEEILRSLDRVRELRQTVLTIPPKTDLKVDANTEQVVNDLEKIANTAKEKISTLPYFLKFEIEGEEKLDELTGKVSKIDNLKVSLQLDLQDFRSSLNLTDAQIEDIQSKLKGLSVQDATKQVEKFKNTFAEINKLTFDKSFKNVDANLRDSFGVASTFEKALKQVNLELLSLGKLQIKPKISPQGVEELSRDLQILFERGNALERDAIKIQAQGLGIPKIINDIAKLETALNKVPSTKNVKINVDTAGINQAGKAVSGVGGFVGQLGSGLFAAFSGAAIGGAIASFATNAVRSIIQASDAADELQDKLRLAFTQAGASGFELDENLQRANEFAFRLGDSFGISVQRSQELLAQVVGLTGEFGATSEAITKASIGIEEATAGLVKAETAAKLFSRSIGNPEDQAALETLAKRFPAIGDAIQSATDPAEKANAVLQNLTGTFTALEEKSQGFGENFQLLSEVAFGTFATALVPVIDSLVPILDEITQLFQENSGAISEFGARIVDDFARPLVNQILEIGPQLKTFFDGLIAIGQSFAQSGFNSITISLNLLGTAFDVIGKTLLLVQPLFQALVDTVSRLLTPVLETLNGQFDDIVPSLETLSFGLIKTQESTSGLNPLFETLAVVADLLVIGIRVLAETFDSILKPALIALQLAFRGLELILAGLNSLFQIGKEFAKDYGIEINELAKDIANILSYIPQLAVLGFIIDKIRRNATVTPDVPTEPIQALDATLFDSVDTTQKFNEQYGIQLPKAVNKGNNSLKKGTEAAKELETELSKQLKIYADIAKGIDTRYNLEISSIEVAQKLSSNYLGRELTDLEKIEFQKKKIDALEKQQIANREQLQKIFGTTFTSFNQLDKSIQEFLEKRDPTVFGIKFDATDSKQVEDAKRVADEVVKLYQTNLQLTSEKEQFEIDLRNVNIKTDQEAVKTAFDLVQVDIQKAIQEVELGINFDLGNEEDIEDLTIKIDRFRTSLSNVRDDAQRGLDPLKNRIKELQDSIRRVSGLDALFSVASIENLDDANDAIDELEEGLSGIEVSGETSREQLVRFTAELNKLREQSQAYNDVNNKSVELQNSLAQAFENAARASARVKLDRELFNFEVDLSVEGVEQGIIEIERSFKERIRNVEIEGNLAIARLQLQGASEEVIAKYAQAQERLVENISLLRVQAIREFNKENNALFAIAESFSRNLAGALAPDNTLAERRFKEREKELNSELELLRANLDINLELNENNLAQRNLTYQEYNAQLLDIERQRGEAQKELDKEIENNRLEGFKRIADEALPGINKQLELETARFTELIKKGTADFETFANKGLETIGLVAAQSLAVAVQQATDLEDIQKLFVKALVRNILQVLKVQLVAAILQAIFRDVEKAGTLGLLTGAIVSGALTALFLKAEKEILALAGYEKGGYTGDGGTKEVAGVVHGQEYVVNAKATKSNMDALEWVNKTGRTFEEYVAKSGKGALSNEKFQILNQDIIKNFDTRLGAMEMKMYNRENVNIQNYVDTKSMNASINSLAYTMDSRLSSLENTVGKAIRENATLTKSANQLDVSVYSDPGTTVKHMRKIGKIKGLS